MLKQGTVARSGVGLFYLCELQVHHLIWQVPLELWEPFAKRHGDDCIAIATGKHSSRSQHSKVYFLHSLCGHCLE